MEEQRAAELLAQARARVQRALGELGPPDRGEDPEPFESGDAAPDMFEAELEEGLAGSLREELRAIERAERRLSEGTYGISVLSGKPIPDARLEAIPWAERTAEEQAR